jgi:hypothetical protein
VRRVQQPYLSFGGRMPEGQDRSAYYRRVHERLRHRQRAVTVWDYERLILEQFPKIALVKCLPHTSNDVVTRAGHVTVAVIPYPTAMLGNRRFYPSLDVGGLRVVANYLNRHNSFFVSGQGSSADCCDKGSQESCGCATGSTLHVRNAVFEPVRLDVCVRFREGKDPLFYRQQLDEALKNFLAPWASDATRPILFGASLSTTQLLRFLENTEYVDVVTQLNVTHYPSRADADRDQNGKVLLFPAEIVPFTPRSVLTTYLDTLNEDNPNALDHRIGIVEASDGCACAKCIGQEKK